jgi:hypothetical protein
MCSRQYQRSRCRTIQIDDDIFRRDAHLRPRRFQTLDGRLDDLLALLGGLALAGDGQDHADLRRPHADHRAAVDGDIALGDVGGQGCKVGRAPDEFYELAFNQVFGVAFVMGDRLHRLPKDAFKSKKADD